MEILELDNLSLQERQDIINSKPVIFVGSAISLFSPTNLLSGELFCKKLFEYIFEKNQFVNLKDSWLKEEFGNIPFEAVMGCYPAKDKLPQIVKSIFNNSQSNSAHDLLASKLNDGVLSSIITTNYDLAFDDYFKKCGFNQFIRNYDEYKIWKHQNDKRSYFKIHGTAEDGYESSLIYALEQEGILEPWKEELLNELLKNKTVIFICYSGKDFDICPLIANMEIPIKVIWLHRCLDLNNEKEKNLTAYGQYLVIKKNDSRLIYFKGIDQFLEKFFNIKLNLQMGTSQFIPSKHFTLTESELYEWQFNILNTMACPSIGMPLVKSLKPKLNKEYYNQILIDMYAHTGEYIKAANGCLDISKSYAKDSKQHITTLIKASDFLLYSGYYFKSYYYLFKAKKLTNLHFSTDNDLILVINSSELVLWMRLNQIFERKKKYFITNYISKRIDALKPKFEQLNKSGLWNLRQGIQHNLERLKQVGDIDLALPANVGYKNLGLSGMALIAFRDQIRYKLKLDPKEIEELDKCIIKAEHLGMSTELWKLCRIRFKNGFNDKIQRKNIWNKWKTNLNKTEYHFTRRYVSLIDLYWSHFRY